MATSNRPTRYTPFSSSANGQPERTASTMPPGLGNWPTTNGSSSIWGQPARREAIAPRDDEPFRMQPATSASYPTDTEVDTLAASTWQIRTDRRRSFRSGSNSGSNSPNRIADNTSLYSFDSVAPSVGTGRPNSYMEERNPASIAGAIETYQKFVAGMSGVGQQPNSRDSSIPPSRHSDDNDTGSPFALYNAAHTRNNSMSKRPNPLHSSSFPVANFGENGRIDINELSTGFHQNVTLDEHPVGNMNGGRSTFGNPGTQPFIPNTSQPWARESNAESRRFNSFSNDLPRPFTSRRTSEAMSHSNGGYGVASPRSIQPTPDMWNARPASREPVPVLEQDRRPAPRHPFFSQQSSTFVPSQQTTNLATPTSFLPPQQASNFVPSQQTSNFMSSLYANSVAGPVSSPFEAFNASPSLYQRTQQSQLNYLNPMNALLQVPPHLRQDPSRGIRSVKLEEFRAHNRHSNRWQLKDILGHVVEFSGDQHGSRFIQGKLQEANSDDKERVFREIEQDAVPLMRDVFGNYVIQKFFEHGDQVQKKILADKMMDKMVSLSTQTYACRVVQKALDSVLIDQKIELAKQLEPDVLRVAMDQNGNHVIQKILEILPRQHTGFIISALHGEVRNLATHNYACRVIQRVLEKGTEQDKNYLLGELLVIADSLFTDQFGNYVVQNILKNCRADICTQIINLVEANFVKLSMHKYASNVVEGCIQVATPAECNRLANHFIQPARNGDYALASAVMNDQYGNYVIQTLFKCLEKPVADALADALRPHFKELRKTNSNKQLSSLDEYIIGSVEAAETSTTTSQASNGQVMSPVPTPSLTTEGNTPESSRPGSTHAEVGEGNASIKGTSSVGSEATLVASVV